jgi:hypothetical protein
VSQAGSQIVFKSGNELGEELASFDTRMSAHRAFDQAVHALDACHHFTFAENGRTLTASITSGVLHLGKQGDESRGYRIVVSYNGVTVGFDAVLARESVVDFEMVLVPIAADSFVPGAFTHKALLKISAPVPVSST